MVRTQTDVNNVMPLSPFSKGESLYLSRLA
jgi:hypothetical protein